MARASPAAVSRPSQRLCRAGRKRSVTSTARAASAAISGGAIASQSTDWIRLPGLATAREVTVVCPVE